MEKLTNLKNKFLNFIYKYRFILAIILLVIGVLLKLHGSSIGLWNSIFSTGVEDNTLLFGKLRQLRSDEWAVTTPLIFSQSFNGFKYFSDILRGGVATDAFSLYGLPVINILEIFRPFHLGYIILGIERGLSFFWIARFIALFLISFELFMVLFNKDKRISLIGAFLILLAPIVQWMFATNGTVELFIYGELALILLYKYMNSDKFKIRLICLFFMMICAGGYIFILYPAFQIPMFFVFLMLAIYIIATNYKDTKISKKDIISIIVMLLIFASLMTYFFIMSKDTITTTLNTVYPGARVQNGGGAFRKYISYIDNIFLPFKEAGMINSEKNIISYSEREAVMFGLFPIGIIFSIVLMIKNRKLDLFSILLLIPYIIVGLFCSFEMPNWFTKITLLSYSAPQKAVIVCGFIDILLLLKFLSSKEKFSKIWQALVASIILSITMVFICKTLNPDYIGKILASILLIMCTYLFFFALEYNTKYGKYLFTVGIIGTMFIAGLAVNPVSIGNSMIYDSPILKSAQDINKEEKGLWLVDAMHFPCPNYLVMCGCEVINATNIYPNLELWEKLDTNKEYEEVYNRYAHVYMEVKNEDEIIEKFVLLAPDKIQVFITPEELKQMNIKYIFTVRVMEDFKNENFDVELIYNENTYHIYRVNYK